MATEKPVGLGSAYVDWFDSVSGRASAADISSANKALGIVGGINKATFSHMKPRGFKMGNVKFDGNVSAWQSFTDTGPTARVDVFSMGEGRRYRCTFCADSKSIGASVNAPQPCPFCQ